MTAEAACCFEKAGRNCDLAALLCNEKKFKLGRCTHTLQHSLRKLILAVDIVSQVLR